MREIIVTLLEMNLYAAIIWAGTMGFKKVAGTRMPARLGLAVWALFIVRLLVSNDVRLGSASRS